MKECWKLVDFEFDKLRSIGLDILGVCLFDVDYKGCNFIG